MITLRASGSARRRDSGSDRRESGTRIVPLPVAGQVRWHFQTMDPAGKGGLCSGNFKLNSKVRVNFRVKSQGPSKGPSEAASVTAPLGDCRN
jgi:hypothetical protein